MARAGRVPCPAPGQHLGSLLLSKPLVALPRTPGNPLPAQARREALRTP